MRKSICFCLLSFRRVDCKDQEGKRNKRIGRFRGGGGCRGRGNWGGKLRGLKRGVGLCELGRVGEKQWSTMWPIEVPACVFRFHLYVHADCEWHFGLADIQRQRSSAMVDPIVHNENIYQILNINFTHQKMANIWIQYIFMTELYLSWHLCYTQSNY